MTKYSKTIAAFCAVLMASTLVNGAGVIPANLPKPDGKPGSQKKPVKVYILAGQSNMVGFGRLGGAAPVYESIFLSADPSVMPCRMPTGKAALLPHYFYQDDTGDVKGAKAFIYKGAYDPRADYDKMKPEKEAVVALGTVAEELPSIEGSHTVVVKAFIEVPMTGTHQIHAGYKDSSQAVVVLDGKEVYRKDGDADAVITDIELKSGKRYPITITYMKGGSAAFWMELIGLKGKGDLKTCIADGKFGWFVDDDGNWAVRNDVIYWDVRTSKEEIGDGGPLSATSNDRSHIGPEVPFGFVMGTFHDEEVLLIESSMGNRALGFDFRPPSSGKTEEEKANKYCGYEYDWMVKGAKKALKNIDKIIPDYQGQGYEIVGFVWWQGHKDRGASKEEYEKHLVNLIQDLRKDLDAPDMKTVVATVGFHGWDLPEGWVEIHAAQMAVGDPEQHPEFKGDVASVDTRGYWRPIGESPTGTDYHYNHNAETYVCTGDALGRAMVELLGGKAEAGSIPPRPPSSSDKPVSEMDLQEMAALVYSDGFVSTYQHDEKEPTAEQVAAMGSALKPIVLDKMLPDYLAGLAAKKDPGLMTLVKGEKVRGYRPGPDNPYDAVVSYYNDAGIHDYDWKRFGPEMQHAVWNYISFDPPEKRPPEQDDRLRDITLPKGSENWFAKDFDPKKAGWKEGPAPFGQKDGKKIPQRPYCKDPDCGCGEIPGTFWEKEVLLMQRTFDVPKLKEGYRYRLMVGGTGHSRTGEGLQVYVNGKKMLETKGGCFRHAQRRGAYFLNDFLPELESGKITIAVKTFLRYTYFHGKTTYFDKLDPEYYAKPVPPNGNISLWLEEAKMPKPVLNFEAQIEEERQK